MELVFKGPVHITKKVTRTRLVLEGHCFARYTEFLGKGGDLVSFIPTIVVDLNNMHQQEHILMANFRAVQNCPKEIIARNWVWYRIICLHWCSSCIRKLKALGFAIGSLFQYKTWQLVTFFIIFSAVDGMYSPSMCPCSYSICCALVLPRTVLLPPYKPGGSFCSRMMIYVITFARSFHIPLMNVPSPSKWGIKKTLLRPHP